MRHSRYKSVGQAPAIKRGLLGFVAPFWKAIEKAAASSLKQKAAGFLPPPEKSSLLGAGFWGAVWPTADKRFVLKASVDNTEGPHVALAMDLFPKHPGMAYYHRLWRLPSRVWTDEQGYSYVWIMLREETDVDSIWSGKRPAAGYKRIHDGLDKLPDCCACLHQERTLSRRSCDGRDVSRAERELAALLKQVGSPASSKGKYVAGLIASSYEDHGILLGDVHFANVGLRRHDLSAFGVRRHKDLVVTDLGDLGQAPRDEGSYGEVRVIERNPYGAPPGQVLVGVDPDTIPEISLGAPSGPRRPCWRCRGDGVGPPPHDADGSCPRCEGSGLIPACLGDYWGRYAGDP